MVLAEHGQTLGHRLPQLRLLSLGLGRRSVVDGVQPRSAAVQADLPPLSFDAAEVVDGGVAGEAVEPGGESRLPPEPG